MKSHILSSFKPRQIIERHSKRFFHIKSAYFLIFDYTITNILRIKYFHFSPTKIVFQFFIQTRISFNITQKSGTHKTKTFRIIYIARVANRTINKRALRHSFLCVIKRRTNIEIKSVVFFVRRKSNKNA